MTRIPTQNVLEEIIRELTGAAKRFHAYQAMEEETRKASDASENDHTERWPVTESSSLELSVAKVKLARELHCDALVVEELAELLFTRRSLFFGGDAKVYWRMALERLFFDDMPIETLQRLHQAIITVTGD